MLKKLMIFMLLSSTIGFGQQSKEMQGRLFGKIIDGTNNQSLSFASVTVFKNVAQRDSLVGGMTVPLNGEFSLNNLPLGKLTIRVSFIGYHTQKQEIVVTDKPNDLGVFALLPDTKMLAEVEVRGEKDAISMGMDKRVFNVAKSITSLGGTAESLLRNVPTITVDENGNPTLRNLATTIYINGKPTQLTLAQIPANQIESVEVISNPSARYDASTSGGIINLVLKKNRENGYNGTANIGYGSNARYDGALNLNYHKEKWNVTTLLNINSTRNPFNAYVNRINYNLGKPVNFFDQNTANRLDNVFTNGRVAVDYSPNQYNTFSVAGVIVGGALNTFSSQDYTYHNANNVLTSWGSRTTTPSNNYTNIGAEFDWKRTFIKKGQELRIATSFTHNNLSNTANWNTTAFNIDGTNQTNYPEKDYITGQQIGSQYLAQLDYVYPLNDSAKVEMGVRSYTFRRDLQYFFNQLNNTSQQYSLLPSYSQNADVLESINALYFLYNKKMRNRLTMEAGLRFEQSLLHGLSRFDNSTFGYDYPTNTGQNWFQSFFPSFALTKKYNNETELGLSLSRKVGRPSFRDIFVGIQSSDRQNIWIGNPNIQPEFVNTAELNYSKNIKQLSWYATAFYIYEDHTIKQTTLPSPTDSTMLITTVVNVKADIQYGIENTLKYSIGNLTLIGNINVFDKILQATTTNSALTIRAKMNVSYRFPYNIVAQVNANYDGRTNALQGYRLPTESADFAIKKSFMQNKASVSFIVNDIFNSRKRLDVYEQDNIYQLSMNRRDIRFYKISLQIPLGRTDTPFRKKEHSIDKPSIDLNN